MASNSSISLIAACIPRRVGGGPRVRRAAALCLSLRAGGEEARIMSASERVAVTVAAPRELASRLDRAFGLALEIGTATLVVAEIVILFVGIVARYAFHHPLIWSDELASLLFLWLAMLGAVLALRRDEHMRMTAMVNALGLRGRHFFDLLAFAAALAFLFGILLPALDYANGEAIVSLMSLDISLGWRA